MNPITVQDYEIARNIIRLSRDGLEVFTKERGAEYHILASMNWDEDEPVQTLRNAIDLIEKPSDASYDFFLDDGLTNLKSTEKQFGTGWVVELNDDVVELRITSVFAKDTKILSLDRDVLNAFQAPLRSLAIPNVRIFFRAPTVDFRFYTHLDSLKLLKNDFHELKLNMATKLPKFVYDVERGCHDEHTQSIKQDTRQTAQPIKQSTDGFNTKACNFIYLLDEKEDTILLTSSHILSNSDDACVIEFGLWCGQFDNRFEKYITVSDKFEITSEELTDNDITDFVKFIKRMLNLHSTQDIVFVFDSYLSNNIGHDAFHDQFKSNGIEVNSVFALANNRGDSIAEVNIDWNKHVLISSDEYFYKNPNYPNTHVYSINFNSVRMLSTSRNARNDRSRLIKFLKSATKL